MENSDSDVERAKRLLKESDKLLDHISVLTEERAKLNPLPGSLRQRLIQCGKQSCRCRTGALHGPYYYFEPSRQHGKWRYVSRESLVEVKKGIADWKKQQEIDKMLQAYATRLETLHKALQKELAAITSP